MAEFLYRRNTVLEALRSGRRQFSCLWLQKGQDRKVIAPILAEARLRAVRLEEADRQKLGQLAQDSSHQGVVLEVGPFVYGQVAEMLTLAGQRNEKPFLLLLDLLHGPHNIGALLRTAEICGLHGVIIQDRRAPEITPAVVIHSAGAAEHLLIAQVTNLGETMRYLKEQNIWLVGLEIDPQAKQLGQIDLNMAVGLVVGNEGEGLRRLVRERCDWLLSLPMRGHVESLNAAVAGSLALYAAWQARGFK